MMRPISTIDAYDAWDEPPLDESDLLEGEDEDGEERLYSGSLGRFLTDAEEQAILGRQRDPGRTVVREQQS